VLIINNKKEFVISPVSIKLDTIKTLAKNPTRGGIPASEKKIKILEKDHILLVTKKEDKLEINKGDGNL
jgi:hypothetical protein